MMGLFEHHRCLLRVRPLRLHPLVPAAI